MNRIEREKRVIAKMIAMYCSHYHPRRETPSEGLCGECRELVEYAHSRLERCPHGVEKPTCRVCTVHCYSPSHREAIAKVMRYSGPRMLLYHPVVALRHLLDKVL